MKNKTAEINLRFIGLLIIGIVGLLALSFTFLPEDGVLRRVVTAFFSFGVGLLPKPEPPVFAGESSVPIELEQYYDNMVSNIRNSEGKLCLIELGTKPEFDDFSIRFMEDRIQVKNDKKPQSLAYKSKGVELKPCFVGTGANILSCSRDSCKSAYEAGEIAINDELKIAPFLIKFDENHICIISEDINVRGIRGTYNNCNLKT
tara:strand:- start:93 stop:701 length:609 start_codon:yes stop_codon:yes gene_type:complete